MTITETIDHLPYPATDPRGVFLRAWAVATDVAAGVGDDDLGRPSPCSDFDAAAIRGHLLAVGRRVAALGRGEDSFSVEDEITAVDGDDWVAAYREVGEAVTAAWADDATLERTITLPWMEGSGAATLAMYTSEAVVHTWDLAMATGQAPTWDEDVLTVAFVALQMGLPDEGRIEAFEAVRANMPEGTQDFDYPFAAAVAVGDDASGIDRLVAWSGRDPRWSA